MSIFGNPSEQSGKDLLASNAIRKWVLPSLRAPTEVAAPRLSGADAAALAHDRCPAMCGDGHALDFLTRDLICVARLASLRVRTEKA